MELLADPAKVISAYKIINQQLANEVQKKRGEIKLHEERYNSTFDLLLRERQENQALLDVVRKLKHQMQIITNVVVSVQDQTVSMFDRINRPYERAEAMLQNYTPRAQQVFERRRTENPPYVDEDAISEEGEQEQEQEQEQGQEEGTFAEPELATNDNGDSPSNDSSDSNGAAADDAEETFGSNRTRRELRTSGGLLPMNSPLVQRLKRPSKNTSFDESFETIDRERAFNLSRHSQDRRQIYVNVGENISDLSAQCNSSRMDVEEQLSETLRNLSPVAMEIDESLPRALSSSAGDEKKEGAHPDNDNDGCFRMSEQHRSRLKKTASESMLSQIDRFNDDANENGATIGDTCGFGDINEITDFNLNELIASCSTPVSKGCVNKGPPADDAVDNGNRAIVPKTRGGSRRGRGVRTGMRGRPRKAKSENELNTLLNPVVLLRPLTEQDMQVHQRKQQLSRKAKPVGSMKEHDDDSLDHSTVTDGGGLEPSSSTENLSTMSGESCSSRPRRRAAPKTLREPSLSSKLRRN